MVKIYLVDDKNQVRLLRDLNSIKARCGFMASGFRMPETTKEEQKAVEIVIKYCRNNIAKQLKTCKLFGKLSSIEDDEASKAQSKSPLIKVTIGTCCVFADEAEPVLAELQRLDMCKTIQGALKTGKNIFLMV